MSLWRPANSDPGSQIERQGGQQHGVLSFAMDCHTPASSMAQWRPRNDLPCEAMPVGYQWCIKARRTRGPTVFASFTSAQVKWGFAHFPQMWAWPLLYCMCTSHWGGQHVTGNQAPSSSVIQASHSASEVPHYKRRKFNHSFCPGLLGGLRERISMKDFVNDEAMCTR